MLSLYLQCYDSAFRHSCLVETMQMAGGGGLIYETDGDARRLA